MRPRTTFLLLLLASTPMAIGIWHLIVIIRLHLKYRRFLYNDIGISVITFHYYISLYGCLPGKEFDGFP